MLKTSPALCIAFATIAACLTVQSSPIRSSLAGKSQPHVEEEEIVNYWTWPTEETWATAKPTTVWRPQIGVWYTGFAADGYSGQHIFGTWTEESVTSKFTFGYTIGVFLSLEPGHYVLGCDVDGLAQFRLAFYKEVEDGYLHNSWTALPVQTSAGYYERVFTVPEGCSLVALLPTSSQGSAPPLTVTNIEIYRLD